MGREAVFTKIKHLKKKITFKNTRCRTCTVQEASKLKLSTS